jgi:GT2 family glycosyltransferase
MKAVDCDISIIIVSFNTKDLLRQCLRSIYANLYDLNVEVYVVDNASIDGSPEMVKHEFEQVKLIENGENLGFARANNQAIKQSCGRYVLLLNSDTEIIGDTLPVVIKFADSLPDTWGLGCKLLNTDRTVQLYNANFPDFPFLFNHFLPNIGKLFGVKLLKEQSDNTAFYEKTRQVDTVLGAFLLMKREAIEQIGILDERFFIYAEEVDWCYRVYQAGKNIMYFSEATVIHHRNQSAKQSESNMYAQRMKSLLLYYDKHYPHQKDLIWFIIFLGLLRQTFLGFWGDIRRILRGKKPHSLAMLLEALGLMCRFKLGML